jgi:1,4-alpha-glucan branching enzyme
MLAQSSDWAFMIRMGQVIDYARRRTNLHLDAFKQLERQALDGKIDTRSIDSLRASNNLFPTLQFEVFAGPDSIHPLPLE